MKKTVDENCIFCKILAGEIPCARVYEDADIFAFLDINPIAKGHTLVVPKGHYPTLLDMPTSEGEALLRALRVVGEAVLKGTGATGFNCIQNNFTSAGQEVFHTHWHIIPRFEKDGIPHWPGGKYADNAELERFAGLINAFTGNGTAGGLHE